MYMANQHPQSEILYRDSKYELTDMKNGNSESPIQLFVLYQPKLLINRLQQLVTSSALCDLAISNGQTVYKLHCAVLTAQSPKYCELYVESASIDQPKEITVNAITKEVLEQILDYLYTGNIVLSDSNIDDILNIAVQLDLVRLKAQCITFLQNYNLVNMLTYTEIAIKFKLDVLHQHMIKYMQGCFSLFNSTLEYQKMSMETLCTLLDSSTLEDNSSSQIEKLHIIIRWLTEDKDKRKVHAKKLLEMVDLRKIHPHKIQESIEDQPDLFDQSECMDSLLTAYKYHAILLSNHQMT